MRQGVLAEHFTCRAEQCAKREHLWLLGLSGRDFWFQAASDDEMAGWVRAVCAAVQVQSWEAPAPPLHSVARAPTPPTSDAAPAGSRPLEEAAAVGLDDRPPADAGEADATARVALQYAVVVPGGLAQQQPSRDGGDGAKVDTQYQLLDLRVRCSADRVRAPTLSSATAGHRGAAAGPSRCAQSGGGFAGGAQVALVAAVLRPGLLGWLPCSRCGGRGADTSRASRPAKVDLEAEH